MLSKNIYLDALFALEVIIFADHMDDIKIMKYTSEDGVQPKTSPFSTHDLILVNYQVVNQLSQLIFLSFS